MPPSLTHRQANVWRYCDMVVSSPLSHGGMMTVQFLLGEGCPSHGACQTPLARRAPDEQGAPLGVVHLARLTVAEKLAQHDRERLRLFQVREVRGARDCAKAAVGSRLMRATAVLERDRVV